MLADDNVCQVGYTLDKGMLSGVHFELTAFFFGAVMYEEKRK